MNEAPTPPQRSTVTILGSFLRGRGTSALASQPTTSQQRDSSRSPTNPPSNSNSYRRRSFARPAALQIPSNTPNSGPPTSTTIPNLGPISNILRRRRSAGNPNNNPATQSSSTSTPLPAPSPTNDTPPQPSPMPAPTPLVRATTFAASPNNTNTSSHRIRLVPHLDSRRTLRFEPISRDLKDGDTPLRIGRFTDRSGIGLASINALSTNKLAFKSKVVSRAHAEIWSEHGKFYIKDTKSSSGTFLNHLRLSPAGSESKPHQLKDGDIVQLGVDYQGGTEDIYKSVKIRVEMGREWQAAPNAFNTNALSQLRSLSADPNNGNVVAHGKKRMPKTNIPDCCICLFAVTIRQALFIAPCSHAFHFKCIRPLLDAHSSAFSCPLCRTFADLNEDVEVASSPEDDDDDDDDFRDNDDDDNDNDENKLLSAPVVRDGAETEVEGDANAGARPRVRIRTAGHVLHPHLPLTECVGLDDADLDEIMMDDSDEGEVDGGSGSGSGSAEGMGTGIAMGMSIGVGMVVDADGVVSGKRKR
ncbi:SMAD/FHA domain-containing protein [Rhizopogon vinicolor AM-OR11-026]|uniref:SMAD/FHA domain-containing protein n=1 Tax=Rhizopogon vinicolor AM-OR11-026 TaxID=1314800 RepID=A0A1B7MM47_9AGAM|nr:SMAD/FHA domain-containing protein [Rhizopogon vinicolor AM-OR11-026]